MSRIDANILDSFLIKTGLSAVTLEDFGTYYGLSDGTYLASAQAYLDEFPDAPDGTYRIQPDGDPNTYDVYCNMQGWGGGGWMRANSSIFTLTPNSTSPTWISGDRIEDNNRASGCGGNKVQWTLTSPKVDYTDVRLLLERTTTILQCSAVTAGQTFGGWYDTPYNDQENSYGMCGWSDTLWGTTTNIGGSQKKYWVMKASGSNKFTFGYQTQCSYAEDTGLYRMEVWVK